MYTLRPIKIFWQEGVSWAQTMLAVKTIYMVLRMVHMDEKIKVEIGGVFDPIMYADADTKDGFWFTPQRNHPDFISGSVYDAEVVYKNFFVKPVIGDEEYRAIFLMKDRIFLNTDNGKKIIYGVTLDSNVIVACVYSEELFKTAQAKLAMFWLIIHEFGHLFGLQSPHR